MNIEFFDNPPAMTRKINSRYKAFSKALKDNEGKWAKLPHTMAKGSANGIAHLIRKGRYDAFTGDNWEAAVRKGVIFVRYNPTETPMPKPRKRIAKKAE